MSIVKYLVVVGEKTFGETPRSENADWARRVAESLGEDRTLVVNSSAEAAEQLRLHVYDAVVFVSRAMIEEAREIARDNPKIRVVVVTGLIPDGEILWANKAWFAEMPFSEIVA